MDRPTEPLTDRELEVVGMVTEDMTNAQIAWHLRISDRTVQAHIRNALEKTGARSRVGLVVHALRAGLVAIAADGEVSVSQVAPPPA